MRNGRCNGRCGDNSIFVMGAGRCGGYLGVGAEVSGAEAVDLVLNRALVRGKKLKSDLLVTRVLRELLVAYQPVGFLVNQHHHPLLVTVVRELRRVDRHRVAQRLGREAQLS